MQSKTSSLRFSAVVVFAILICACSANAEDVDATTNVQGSDLTLK